MELILVLHNIRSAHNVGSILRTADGLGVSKVIFSGYTPRVDDARVLPYLREKLNKQIAKTALGAEKYVENYAVDDIKAELLRLKSDGYVVAGLENNLDAKKPILQMKLANLSQIRSALRSKAVLVLGEEVKGIEKSLYEMMDLFLEIPMVGRKESFNVSIAMGIAGFYIMNLVKESS
ncbi:TrmH family RNA methyltransferase [Candidatus Saccharibacteria bacterium]|nr:TrmH family RNA methyltransferase [Candidatus Saccharibacteria bacterium]